MISRAHTDARLAALAAVNDVLDRRLGLADTRAFEGDLDDRDVAFARHLAYGTLRWLPALDWLATRMLDHPLKPRDADVHRLILLGIYQLWKQETAPHAAVHATAGCAARRGKKWAVGLINALLRRFQRERDDLLAGLEFAGMQHAHPPWLLERLRADWPEDWPALVDANNRQAPLWLRCNRLRGEREALVEHLAAAGHQATACAFAPDALRLETPAPVETLPGFADGLFSVQDVAAQLAAGLLAPSAGERVLDACAAPGGKACHLLEQVPGLDLTILDRSASRAARITQNLERLGLEASVTVGDAAESGHWWDGRAFHRILLDAPCSASGVIRRHPEIKHLRDQDQVLKAQETQAMLLDRLWPLLGAGGMLLYATCSVFQGENSRQIEAFLQRHDDARCTGPDSGPGRAMSRGRQILPGEHDMDGFYYAQLVKTD